MRGLAGHDARSQWVPNVKAPNSGWMDSPQNTGGEVVAYRQTIDSDRDFVSRTIATYENPGCDALLLHPV